MFDIGEGLGTAVEHLLSDCLRTILVCEQYAAGWLHLALLKPLVCTEAAADDTAGPGGCISIAHSVM
jgi:hypothetical protein